MSRRRRIRQDAPPGAQLRTGSAQIRRGAAGYDICFIHPKGNDEFPVSGEGVLIELVQAPPEVSEAYATIAAEGRRATPYYISKVTSTGAHDLEYEVKKDVRRAFPQDVARDTIQAMSLVGQPGGTGYPTVADLGRPVGGKTGTTSNNYAAWFDGFTPGQLATAVGMYKGDGSLTEENQLSNVGEYGEITGGTVPARIWTDYMIGALEGEPVKRLPPPGNVKYRPQTDPPTDAPAPITTTQAPAPTPTTTRSPSSSSSSSKSSSSSSSSTSKSTSTSTSTSTTKSPTSTPKPTSSTPKPTSSTPKPTSTTQPPEPPEPTLPSLTPGGRGATEGRGD